MTESQLCHSPESRRRHLAPGPSTDGAGVVPRARQAVRADLQPRLRVLLLPLEGGAVPRRPLPDDRRLLDTYIRQVLESHSGPEVTIAWQGGEPTLMGVDFFRRAIGVVEQYRRPGQVVHHTIQTNAHAADRRVVRAARRARLPRRRQHRRPRRRCTTPTASTRRATRPSPRCCRGYELLQRHDVDTNVLCTVNAANQDHPLEVYRYFRDDLGAPFIQFIPIVERDNDDRVPGGRPGHRPLGRPRRLGPVHDRRSSTSGCAATSAPSSCSSSTPRSPSWLGLPPALCIFAETCGNAVALEHNGDLYSCDHFVEPEHLLGNIMTTHMVELVASPQQRAFGDAKRDTLPRYCLDCEVRFACNGECPKNRFTTTPDGEPGLNYLCAGYKAFFTHVDGLMRAHGRPRSRRRLRRRGHGHPPHRRSQRPVPVRQRPQGQGMPPGERAGITPNHCVTRRVWTIRAGSGRVSGSSRPRVDLARTIPRCRELCRLTHRRMLTARATTSTATTSDIAASSIMRSFAHDRTAGTSVGLNAVDVVKERWR